MTPETLQHWIRREETDSGLRSGLTTSERGRMKELEHENRESRRANEILQSAIAASRLSASRRMICVLTGHVPPFTTSFLETCRRQECVRGFMR